MRTICMFWPNFPQESLFGAISLDYSRFEVVVDARRLGSGFVVKRCSVQNAILFLIMRIKPDPGCGRQPRLGCHKADVVARGEATALILFQIKG